MKKTLPLMQLMGFIFTGISGVILHFLYDWTGKSILVAPFSAVNESIWEHMKLLYLPMFIYAIIESRFIGEKYENFWCVKLVGILFGITLIPTLYYTYTGALGIFVDWLNIAIFYITAATTYLLETRLLRKKGNFCASPVSAFIALCVIGTIFIAFTFFAPHIPLFEDPITHTYGLTM